MSGGLRRLLMAVALLAGTAAQAGDGPGASIERLVQGLRRHDAGLARAALAADARVVVIVREPDGPMRFTFGREDFLQTYTSLWRFATGERIEMSLVALRPDGSGRWIASGRMRESMVILGETLRRDSTIACTIRWQDDAYRIVDMELTTVLQ